jgi:ABC-2 type transport system permease protein
MNKFLLWILSLFKGLFKIIKVDYQQLAAIVAIKLTMDNRRQPASYKRKKNNDPDYTFVMTIFFYGVLGVLIAIGLYGFSSFIVSMIIFFSYIMVMISMTLITDFSSILLDTSDNTIILPRPVDGRTLFVARIVHIMFYLGILTLALAAAPTLVVLLKYGLTLSLLFGVLTVLSVLTAVAFTNILYLLIMQFANEEKLKNVINYFQIAMAVFIMGGYQLLPRMIGKFYLEDFEFQISWWSYFIPPIWMGAALETWYLELTDLPHIILTVLAITIPAASFYLINRYLTPIFSRKIASMGVATQTIQHHSTSENGNFITRISHWITSSATERGTFQLIFKLLGRDRKIKLKIYPSFGYMIVFGLLFIVRGHDDIMTTLKNLPNTEYYLMLIYFTFMVIQVAFYEIPYSDDFKASWIYFSAPVANPGEILSGTIKAIFVRLFIPGYLVITAVVLAVWGLRAFDDVIFGFFNNFLMLVTIALINKKFLPLSMEPSVRSQTGSLIRGLIMLVILGVLGFGHYLLSKNTLLLVSVIPVQLVLVFFLLRLYKQTSWSQLYSLK